MSLDDAKFLLMKEIDNEESDTSNLSKNKFKAEKEQFILNIYEYWRAKRLKYVNLFLKFF